MPMFSKRHYEAIATLIQQVCAAGQPCGVDLGTVGYVADKFAVLFANDNPRFDCARFEAACVPGRNVKAKNIAKAVFADELRGIPRKDQEPAIVVFDELK